MLLTFLYHNWDAPFYYKSLITFLLIGMVFVIISGMFYGRIYLTWMILLLKLCLRSEFRFKLMYVCLIESIRSILLYLHVFNLLLLLSMQEISSITATNRTDMLWQRTSSERTIIIAKGFVNLQKLLKLTKQLSLSSPENLVFVTFCGLQVVFLTMVTLLFILYLMRSYLLYLMEQRCLLKSFLKTILHDA